MLSMATGVDQTLVRQVVRTAPILGDDVVDLDGLSGDEPDATQRTHVLLTPMEHQPLLRVGLPDHLGLHPLTPIQAMGGVVGRLPARDLREAADRGAW